MLRAVADEIPGLLDLVTDEMVELRHDLHAHPELSFAEYRTTALIRERLAALGWELRPCPTATGSVARLVGATPGRRVLLRADIDALPVGEESGLPFASTTDGVMHACGHDVHTAALLGVADLLARCRDELCGEFVVVFQPAEEVIGGARAMIAGGVLDDNPVDHAVGAHVTSLAPVGTVVTRPGVFMSRAAMISLRLSGRGGHGAMAPSEGNVILAASALAPRLADAVAGLSFEGVDCACSAGVLRAGTANNVVPRDALVLGTLRTFAPGQHDVAVARLREAADEVAERFAVAVELEVTHDTPPVVNDPATTEVVREAASSIVGTDGVLSLPPVTPSDDVSEFWRRVPGCYFFVGGALADGTSGMHHSGDFAVDDGALRVQAGVLAASAVRLGGP